jgi:N-acetylmuramoyl-L-alanine amidase
LLSVSSSDCPYAARVTASKLNVRQSASLNSSIVGVLVKGQEFTIIKEQNNFGNIGETGGWVSLNYIERF